MKRNYEDKTVDGFNRFGYMIKYKPFLSIQEVDAIVENMMLVGEESPTNIEVVKYVLIARFCVKNWGINDCGAFADESSFKEEEILELGDIDFYNTLAGNGMIEFLDMSIGNISAIDRIYAEATSTARGLIALGNNLESRMQDTDLEYQIKELRELTNKKVEGDKEVSSDAIS